MRIIVVADHKNFRKAVVDLLHSVDELIVVAETGSPDEVLKLTKLHNPDILLIDISLSGLDIFDLLVKIKKTCNNCRIILLTIHKELANLSVDYMSEIHGFILKDDIFDDLINGLKLVSNGQKFRSSSISLSKSSFFK